MDLVNIRKKAQKEREEEEKAETSTQKEAQDKIEEEAVSQHKERLESEQEPEKPIQIETPQIREEVTESPVPSAIVGTSERTREEIYEETEEVEVVSFRLGDETYGVRIDLVKEILKPLKITPVPRTPHYLEGVTSLRGEIIPLFDLKKRLGLEGHQDDRKRRILILSVRNEKMGALVDEVRGVVKLHRASIEPPPTIITGIEAEFLEGVSRIDDQFIGLLNIEEVMKI